MNNSFEETRTLDQIAAQKSFITRVYAWMVAGLFTTALTAVFVISSGLFITLISNSILFFGMIIGEFALVAFLSARIHRMKSSTAMISFLAYSILNGITLTAILAIYSFDAVISTFLSCSAMFGAASFYGLVTKRDLTGVGSFFFMGLIGLIAMSVVNIFLNASALDFGISFIGVIIFVGLTAYDSQRLKDMSLGISEEGTLASNGAILGALSLYINFINIFLFLLRLFGRRD